MADRPTLFVIGDSISIQYGPPLQQMLAERFDYARKTGEEEELKQIPEAAAVANGGDSSRVLTYLRAMIAGGSFRPDLLLLNCGLHDIMTHPETGAKQIPLDEYRRNLEAMVDLLRDRGIRTLWVRTTPVDDETHNARAAFRRYAADQQAYNAAADEIMTAAGVSLVDLDAFTRSLGGPEVFCDHAHFTEPVRQKQAAFIAGSVLAHWGGAG